MVGLSVVDWFFDSFEQKYPQRRPVTWPNLSETELLVGDKEGESGREGELESRIFPQE